MSASTMPSPRTGIAAFHLAFALCFVLGGLFTSRAALAEEPRPSVADVEFFEEKIRPVLVERCYKCHSATSESVRGGLRVDDREAIRAGGDSGPSVVPGKPDESLLLQALAFDGQFYDMPPDGKLDDPVLADFRRWIESGAADPREPVAVAAAKPTQGPASTEDLWVSKPLVRPQLPPVTNQPWSRTDVDRFILARLEAAGLAPASGADRPTLLRRVTFDLTGLPPTPEELAAFEADEAENAYERVVDRLLDSPAFGDHWARHWFDVSCYADLADIQGNVVIRDAWRYRDYVIGALNMDKPWDRFIHEQIAGDLLPYESAAQQREQIIATGYLSIGPWTLQNYVKEQLRADVVDHQVDKIGRTFLGMSVRCARCHDHKFDPIPTRDYYAMAGIFQNTLTTRYDGPGVWSQIVARPLPESDRDIEERERAVAAYDAAVAAIAREREQLTEERQRILSSEVASSPPDFTRKVEGSSANAITQGAAVDANETGRAYRVRFQAGPSVWNAAVQATGKDDQLLLQVLRADGSVLAHHLHAPGAWTNNADAQSFAEASFTYTGDGSGGIRLHITGYPVMTGRFAGAIDDVQIVDESSGETRFADDFRAYQPGPPSGSQANTGLSVHAQGQLPGWMGAGINPTHAVDRGQGNYAVQIFAGEAGASSDPRVAAIDGQLGSLASRLRVMEYNRPGVGHALAVQDMESPHDMPIFIRGNFQTPGALAPRGALTSVTGEPMAAIPPGTSGRKELAEWITSPGNSLTPRVLANRIWLHVFGAGLVQSVDYFGIHGDQPSHPELLDHLAVRFRDDFRWSLKSLVRELVLSSTYRMSSEHSLAGMEKDPDNRLMWRMHRRRLPAEAIRDAMMAISGTLDQGRGGPCLGLDIPGNVAGIDDQVNSPVYTSQKTPDHVARRRAIYLPLLRTRPTGELEILSIFDFPHPNEVTGDRPETTVATQALYLMNAPFVKDQASATATRILAEAGDSGQRIQSLYRRVLGRAASEEEVQQSEQFLTAMRQSSEAEAELLAWTQLSHALLASNGFLFVE